MPKILVLLTDGQFHDADDIPMIDNDTCRYWGAFEDSPEPNTRVWVLFDRKPESYEEAYRLVREYLGYKD